MQSGWPDISLPVTPLFPNAPDSVGTKQKPQELDGRPTFVQRTWAENDGRSPTSAFTQPIDNRYLFVKQKVINEPRRTHPRRHCHQRAFADS
jgi:hypothetical protein